MFVKAENNLINNENITQKLFASSGNKQVILECKNDGSSIKNCNFLNIENNREISNIIKNNLKNIYDSEKRESQVIKGEENIIFQITNGKNELELLKGECLKEQNISILDLSQYENILRKIYQINQNDYLIFFKQENINETSKNRNSQYEVFDPHNFIKLN